jgi:hypothetical protein
MITEGIFGRRHSRMKAEITGWQQEDSRIFVKILYDSGFWSSLELPVRYMTDDFYREYEQEIELIIKNNLEKPINIHNRRIEI